MGLMKEGKSWMKKFEKLHLGLKFLILGGSAWLLYRKFQKEGEPIPILSSVLPSATTPLATPTTTNLDAAGANPVAYQGASPDQLNTTRQLTTTNTQPLDPSALAAAALATGGKQLLTNQGMEDKKAADVALKAGDIFQAFIPGQQT
jgi:hypothetical protein